MAGLVPVKVEVHSERITSNSGEKNGRVWSRHKQAVWVYMPGEPYPTKALIEIPTDQGQTPLALTPGVYDVDLSLALSVGKYDDLELDSRLIYGSFALVCDLDGAPKK